MRETSPAGLIAAPARAGRRHQQGQVRALIRLPARIQPLLQPLLNAPDLQALEPSGVHHRELRLLRTLFQVRSVGLATAGLTVAASLAEQAVAPVIWLALLLNVLVWPTLALRRARAAGQPLLAEGQHLLIDSALAGVWVALLQFSPLPSLLLLSGLLADRLAFGGGALAGRSLLFMAGAALGCGMLLGFPFHTGLSPAVLAACLPYLLIHPAMVSYSSNRLLHRAGRHAARLARVSRLDGLTQVANRHSWSEQAEQEMRRARRTQEPASLLVIDLDRFKGINDRYGHAVGDDVLRHLSSLLRQTVREVDLVGRYGGDEFTVLLPGADQDVAQAVAERLRTAIRKAAISGASPAPYTVSIGQAQLQIGVDTLREWFTRADRSMYTAKQDGRDRSAA